MVSVPPTKPPLLLYTLLGYVTSTDREAPFLGVPVLLERGPGPRLLVSEEFTYLVEHVPLPPRDKHYILTLNLVAEGLRLTRRYEITHTGGWREERGWLGRRIESYKARRFFKTAKRV